MGQVVLVTRVATSCGRQRARPRQHRIYPGTRVDGKILNVMARDDTRKTRAPSLLEEILGVCLARLETKRASILVRALRDEALECQLEIASWTEKEPTSEVRAAMRERVLVLHSSVSSVA
jgi:hypothetical protein